MDIIPPGGRIVEACKHGNPMNTSCKLCGRYVESSEQPGTGAVEDPNRELKDQLLVHAYGLIVGVDDGKADKQSKDWQASSAEWVEQYGQIAPKA